MPDLQELGEVIKRGDRDKAASLTQAAIDAQVPAQEILDVMVSAMDVVGQRFQKNEIFVPEMLIAARAMKEAMKLLEPVLVAAGITPVARAVIGTVEGDLHDIGKNLVAMMWKGANFDVIDLGTNVSPQKFVDAIRTNDAQLVGLSALLTTTMPAIKTTVAAIKAAGFGVTKVVIGGAPVTQEYADEVGADGYAPDAASAVDVARSLL
ncbi:MAG: corrinoid protein [Pirellulaceae bacterium]